MSREEAEETLRLWYADRPEVKAWQEAQLAEAREVGYVRTLLGRRRQLEDVQRSSSSGPGSSSARFFRAAREHAERAAINTPVQGGAADVVMAAMIRLWEDQRTQGGRLHRLGYRMLLQVHDEIVLEGPEAHAEAAAGVVAGIMENPFGAYDEAEGREVERFPLRVKLRVVAGHARTWHDAKP